MYNITEFLFATEITLIVLNLAQNYKGYDKIQELIEILCRIIRLCGGQSTNPDEYNFASTVVTF